MPEDRGSQFEEPGNERQEPSTAAAEGDAEDTSTSPAEAPREGEAISDFFDLSEVFHRVLATAHHELSRPVRLLFWSGLAGGLALGMSLVARAALTAEAPGNNALIGNLLYPIGFIILILGRYQLFTENTLTPVTLVLTRFASLRDLFVLWGVVFAANILGALMFAGLLGPLHVLSDEASRLAVGFGEHLVSAPWIEAFGRAVIAGWLLAIVVWLVHASRETLARIVVIWLLIYLQISGDLFHSVVGALEVQYAMFQGAVTLRAYIFNFQIPVTLGNIVGGVVFVAVLNYMQLGSDDEPEEGRRRKLSARDWILGSRGDRR